MPKIFGHRGASGYAPENTLEAFELAAKLGAHGVELDVQITKDGELVVAHDETVDRVANDTGFICEKTLAELRTLRFNKTHPEYVHAEIPTLREVYELLRPFPMEINVELKNSHIFYKDLAEKCVELAAKTGMTDRVFYSSFNHYSMADMKRKFPEAVCGVLYEATLVEPWKYAKALGVDAIHPHFTELLVEGEAEKAHSLGLKVNVWTANTEEEILACIRAGADTVITNYPDIGLKALAESGI